jgi:hypothetical protein
MQPKTRIRRDWLVQAVSFYQNLGFFDQWSQIQIVTLIADLLRELDDRDFQALGRTIDTGAKYADLVLLRYDKARVWWDDTEADVAPGNEVYRSTILQWANISRGAFSPQNVHETWVTETGPVYITFTLFDQPVKIRAGYFDDYIDMDILRSINKLLVDTDFQYKMYQAFGQDAFVLVLKADEAEILQSARGWRFQPGI